MTPQSHKVIELLQHHPLDYLQAKIFGIQRLSARISECRGSGYDIKHKMVLGTLPSGKKIRYAVYTLGKQKECKPRHEEILWECICPRCGKRHQKYLFWTGNGTPRFYCAICRAVVG